MAEHLWQYRTLRAAQAQPKRVRACLACGLFQEPNDAGNWPTPVPADCAQREPTDVTTQTIYQAIRHELADVSLLPSRFTRQDRTAKEQRILDAL